MWLARFWKHEPILILLVVTFLLFAGLYSVVIPAFESPDEPGHFYYVVHLVKTRSLPIQRIGELGEAHQPPLYYLVAAIAALPADLDNPAGAFRGNPQFIWAGQGGNDVNAGLHNSIETFPYEGQALALHLARGVSVLMGLITVVFTVLIGWKVFPDYRVVGFLAGALVAFNPQFLFISGSVNNDNLLVMVATIAWWQVLKTLKHPNRWQEWLYLGILIALGILTKLSGFVIGLVAGCALIVSTFQQRSLKVFMYGVLMVLLPVALITGGWFVRNQALYGDPLGWTTYSQVFAVNLRHRPLQWEDLHRFFLTQFRSFWGVFGWMNLSAPGWFYQFFQILCLLGLIGLGASALQGRFAKLSASQRIGLSVLTCSILAQEMYMIAVITQCNPSCYQGRYLFPVIGPLAIVISFGLVNFLPRRVHPLMAFGLGAALMSIAGFMLFGVIAPAYKTPTLPKWQLWFVPNRMDVAFGDMFRLRGYELRVDTYNSQAALTLYWQASRTPDFNYSVFVHLIDESGEIVGQKDHAPGESISYPPVVWWPGDIIADEHNILYKMVSGTGTYRFRVGVYNWVSGERLPAMIEGRFIGDFIVLDQTMVLH
jgi:hypothetical protein